MSSLRLGLTGGLASGKSTVARWLEEAGCFMVDADRLVARLYEPGEFGEAAARELFGKEILDQEGRVSRPALARRIFGDEEARRRLEAVIHPLVRQRFEEIARERDGIVGLEATLLVEAGYGPAFDLVVSVEADPEVRLQRAVERGMDRQEAEARMEAQGDGQTRRRGADRILRNDGTLEELRRQVEGLVEEMRGLLEADGRDGARPLHPGTRDGRDAGDPPPVPALVTGNPGKVDEARRLAGLELEWVDLDLQEIQSLDPREVLAAKGAEAWRRVGGRPLIVEEAGLELTALNGFPGPFTKWMLAAIGPEGIARIAHRAGEVGARARCLLLLRNGEEELVVEGITEGVLVLPGRGTGGFGFDPVFRPRGSDRTFAELGPDEKDALSHRGKAWRALKRMMSGEG